MEELVKQEYRKSEVHGLSIKEMVRKYIRFWPLFLLSIVLSMAVSWAYLRWTAKSYRATGVLLVQSEKKGSGLDKLEQAMTVDPMKDVQTEIEILRSRPLMERVVKALDLNFSYTAKGGMKQASLYKDLPFHVQVQELKTDEPFSWEVEFVNAQQFRIGESNLLYRTGDAFKTPEGTFLIKGNGNSIASEKYVVSWAPTLQKAIGLINNLEISPKLNTGVVSISMLTGSPDMSADIVNQLMVEYGKMNIEEKNVTTHQRLQFIEAETKLLLHQLDSMNDRLVAFREKYRIVDPKVQSSAYLNRIEDNLQKLNEQRVQIQNVSRLEDYLKRNGDAALPSSLGVEDPTLSTLIDAYNEVQLEKKELLANAPAGNMLVKQKSDRAETLRLKLLENIRNIKAGFNSVVGSLQSTSGSAIAQASTIPAHERELEDIRRDMESKLVIYNNMLVSKEQAAIALASTISNTKIVQEALPENMPVKPNRGAVRFLALMLGVLVPLSIIIIRELLNDKITSRQDIERLTEATLLAEIGRSTAAQPVVARDSRKAVAEQFRMLRSNLQFVLRNVQTPVILVSSSVSGEGKSFVSTNTAAVMSFSGKKTVLLEFDIRKPKVLSYLGLQAKQGLTNYLLGKVEASQLPVPVPGNENLFVLPCGPLPPNPSELLLDPKVEELFDYLKEHFDAVVVDTAPVGMVSDALTLGRFADCTLFVVRENYTLKKHVALIDDYYHEGRLPKISMVLNDTQAAAAGAYGSGSGYFDDEPPARSTMVRWLGWLNGKNGTSSHKTTRVS